MLHELVLLGCHSQFASYPYTLALYLYSCKILQPYVVARIRTHSDVLLSSTGAPLMKTVIKIVQFGTQGDILIRDHDVRTYFTGPHKILHFAGSGHRRILELWGGSLLSRDP